MHPPVSSPPTAGETWYPVFLVLPVLFGKKKEKGKKKILFAIDTAESASQSSRACMLRTCTSVGMPPCIDHVCCVVWPVSSSWCGSGRCTTSTTDPMLQVDPPTLSPCAHPCVGPHVSTRSSSMLGWTRCYGIRVGKTCVPT